VNDKHTDAAANPQLLNTELYGVKQAVETALAAASVMTQADGGTTCGATVAPPSLCVAVQPHTGLSSHIPVDAPYVALQHYTPGRQPSQDVESASASVLGSADGIHITDALADKVFHVTPHTFFQVCIVISGWL
jgi:hypothetical protein